MKKLVLLFALIVCGCGLNGVEKPSRPDLQFQVGDVVDLKIGGQGQIIQISGRLRPYWVRIRTDNGTERVWLDEFELEIK